MAPPEGETNASGRRRQLAGAACEDCRRRKLRCDRDEPSCGNCVESGLECTRVSVQPARGPKKGHLNALKNRIASLERALTTQNPRPAVEGIVAVTKTSPQEHVLPAQQPSPPRDVEADDNMPNMLTSLSGSSRPTTSLTSRNDQSDIISPLVRADLELIYFERVHPFVPMLRKEDYFSWSKAWLRDSSQVCLQLAMWTIAASVSAHPPELRERLDRATRASLDLCFGAGDFQEPPPIQIVQAWLLLAIYDFTRVHHWSGWLSAGRAYRIIQLMKLHQLDAADELLQDIDSPVDWIRTEEKRRTFWVAYMFDAFINLHQELPLTFHEHTISTRLPASEESYQAGIPVSAEFLSDHLAADHFSVQSPFVECILAANVCMQTLTHKVQTRRSSQSGTLLRDFYTHHNFIDTFLMNRVFVLSQLQTSSDSFYLFTKMMNHACIIVLNGFADATSKACSDFQTVNSQYHESAWLAALEIARLTDALPHIGLFKAHPLTLMPIIISAEFLSAHASFEASSSESLQKLSGALKYLGQVNKTAHGFALPMPKTPCRSRMSFSD